MAAAFRRFRPFVFAPWLVIVLLAAGCESLEIGDRQPSTSGPPVATEPMPETPAEGGDVMVRPGGPPPPTGDGVRVGLLLPLSGPQAGLGKAMLKAAELALFDLGDQRFELLSYDTKGTPEGASAAAQTALGDGSTLLLGPLLSSSARAVAPIAAAAGVPVVSFSSDRTVAGSGVYILGFTPEAEVRRVMSHAVEAGLTRMAVLAPQDAYGNAVVSEARQAATALGARLIRVQFYDPAGRDFGPAVEAVARAQAAGSSPPFDALLIADGGERLRGIGAQLPVHGVQQPTVRVLGTGAWDDVTVGSEPALVGGWFAAPSPAYRESFQTQYRDAFGQQPPRLATLAYDATALAAVLAASPSYVPFDRNAIEDPKGFLGRDGIFRFGPDGVVQRGLAVLEVDRGGRRVISEPPTAFGGS
ncbi:MAG TPA: penicillin-binding protein activator [Rhodospirillales bacterium]|nr:penicillin-binding protein activator [Rhodospirillales bacterium]